MTRSVEVQEGQLEQDREKTQEEVFQKFAEWAQHPAIRKTFFLEPQARMAQLRANLGQATHPRRPSPAQGTGPQENQAKGEKSNRTKTNANRKFSKGKGGRASATRVCSERAVVHNAHIGRRSP